MADLSDVYGKSNLFKAEDLAEGDLELTIASMRTQEFDDGGRKKQKLVLSFEEDPRSLVLNITNAKKVAEQHGRDHETWIGKTIILTVRKVEYQNREVDAIRIRSQDRKVIRKPQQAPQQQYPRQGAVDMDDDVPF